MAENRENSYREKRKNELRSRIVDAEHLPEESAERNRNRGRRRLLFLLLLLLLLALGLGLLIFLLRQRYTKASENWSVSFSSEEGIKDTDYEQYELFGNGFLKVTRDGAAYVDQSGKTVWNQAYEMNNPYVSINGDYCAIADQGRTSVFIIGKAAHHPVAVCVLANLSEIIKDHLIFQCTAVKIGKGSDQLCAVR